MNTPSTFARIASFAIACTMTVFMLVSVNSLATSEASPQLNARVAASANA